MTLVSELMSLSTRIAVVVGLFFLAGVALATFLPSRASTGTACGSWVRPAFDDATTTELLTRARELYGRARGQADDASAGQAARIAATVRQAAGECDRTLGDRRAVALTLAGLAVVGPVGVAFIGGAQRETATTGHRP